MCLMEENMRYIVMQRLYFGGVGMQQFLKHYKVKIRVLSPIFIGSGEKIGKKSTYICRGITALLSLMWIRCLRI